MKTLGISHDDKIYLRFFTLPSLLSIQKTYIIQGIVYFAPHSRNGLNPQDGISYQLAFRLAFFFRNISDERNAELITGTKCGRHNERNAMEHFVFEMIYFVFTNITVILRRIFLLQRIQKMIKIRRPRYSGCVIWWIKKQH